MFRKIVCLAICIVISFSLASCGKDMALKDIKSVYVDYKMKIPNPYWRMKDPDRKEYKEGFIRRLSDIGFTVVETPEKADALLSCSFENVEKRLKWVALDEAMAEFTMPGSNVVIASFKVGGKEWAEAGVTVKDAEDKLLCKIKYAYDSDQPQFKKLDDGSIVKIEEQYLPTHSGDIAIKDFKNAYVELVTDSIATHGMDEKTKDKYISRLQDEMKKIGFTIVNDATKSNVKIAFHMTGLAYGTGFGWLVDKLWVEFSIPETEFFVARMDAARPNWSTLDSMLKNLIGKIADEYSSPKNTYKVVDKSRLDEIKKSVLTQASDKAEKIFKDRPARYSIRKSDYQDIGIIILPIWGEGQFWGSGSPLSFAYWFGKPNKNDIFKDIASRDNKKSYAVGAKEKMYLMREISREDFPSIEVEHGSLTYFREDFCDIIFTAFSNATNFYKVNLKELRFEDYREDILSSGIAGVLAKIKTDHPELKQIFIVYYIPFSDWVDVKIAGNYKYYFSKHGLLFFVFTSYFDLEGNGKNLMDFKAEINYDEPMIVTVSYNKAEKVLEDRIKNALLKETKSSTIKGFTPDMKRDDIAYVQRKGTVVKTIDGKAIAQLDQRTEVTVEGKDSGKAKILVTAFVDVDKVTTMDRLSITPRGDKTLLRKNTIFENRYGGNTISSGEILGRFSDNTPIEPVAPITVSEFSPKFYRVIFSGYVDENDISSSDSVFENKGAIKGQILKDGVPLNDAQIYIRPIAKKEKVTTDKNGYFEFTGVMPACHHSIFLAKDKKDDPYRYRIKNLPQEIVLNPDEVLDIGKINVDDANLYDTNATIDKVKEMIKVMRPDMSTKANAIAYFGEPIKRYTNDIWGFQYTDTVEILAYFQDDKVKNMGFIAKEEEKN